MKICRPSILMLGAFTAAALLAACATSRQPKLQTVDAVDLNRYAGKWYEIASIPVWFQRGCASGTHTEYTPNPDGSIRVVNTCYDKDGKPISVTGRATAAPNTGNAKLKVGFFGPFTGDYWIIALDKADYSWALVGHPSRKYLWILSRAPEISDALYEKIVAEAVLQGYDATKLRRTDPSTPR
jgi:apolipoprotein D and lipocalin family protein